MLYYLGWWWGGGGGGLVSLDLVIREVLVKLPRHQHQTSIALHLQPPSTTPSTHARPSLPVNPNPILNPPEEYKTGIHYTATMS